ncbi:MAG: efflux RND transporter periplasmic adaptor subunit [Halioglobus sp.]
MNKKLVFPVLMLLGGVAVAFLIANNKPHVEVEPYQRTAPTVRVLQVQSAAERLTITSQGTVAPGTQSELIPEVSGRVTWVSPALVSGGAFSQGEVLLRIDEADYQNQRQRSLAAKQRGEVEHQHAMAELERLRSLRKRNLASEQQVDDAQRTARVADANLKEASANLAQSERDLTRTELSAPFSGLVRSEQVDLGQFVTRGQSIATIYATDYVEVRLPISAAQLGFIGLPINTRGEIPAELSPPVTVSAAFGDTNLFWEGQLVRLEAEIDERSRMIYGVAKLELDDDAQSPVLPIGLFVQADIQGRLEENVIRLPRSAMRDANQVLVVDSENRLHFRQITPLRLEHDEVLVSSGLANGELVSVSPMQTVVEGMHVQPVME